MGSRGTRDATRRRHYHVNYPKERRVASPIPPMDTPRRSHRVAARRAPPLADESCEKKQRPPRIPPRPEDLVNARKARVCSQPSHATPDAPRREDVMDTPTTMRSVASEDRPARRSCRPARAQPPVGVATTSLLGKRSWQKKRFPDPHARASAPTGRLPRRDDAHDGGRESRTIVGRRDKRVSARRVADARRVVRARRVARGA